MLHARDAARSALLALTALLAACAADRRATASPQPVAAPTVARADDVAPEPEPEPGPTPDSCETPELCLELGSAQWDRLEDLIVYERNDEAIEAAQTALAFYERACTFGDAWCRHAGWVYLRDGSMFFDAARGLDLIERGCAAGDGLSCRFLGYYHARGRHGFTEDPDRALQYAERGCELGDGGACSDAAHHHRDRGTSKEERRPFLARACELSWPDSCRELADLDWTPLLTLEGANVTMADSDMNGLRTAELACVMPDADPFQWLVVLGSLAEGKAAFDACAPAGDATVIEWKSRGGKVQDATAAGASTPKVDTCVAKALRKIPMPAAAHCAAVLELGAKKGSTAAVTRLREGPPKG